MTTALFIDDASIGQYVFSPGSQRSFSVFAGTHTARATELGGSQREFPAQAVEVPVNGSALYLMVCRSLPPPPEDGPGLDG
ncbi:MAG: hypothetical protein HY705_04765 [Gemmatimonadetes bacterium]|nr:hypothetical protein [Gemmatimonadota bacterium]